MEGLIDFKFIALLDLVETIATVVTLCFAIITIRSNSKTNQAVFVNRVYENFQEVQLAILGNPDTLKIMAQESGEKKKEVRKNALASLLINNSYNAFRSYKQKHIPLDLWERFEGDMKELFAWEFIYDRWLEIRSFFPKEFQLYINQNIITSQHK